jgi:hypothetical protein
MHCTDLNMLTRIKLADGNSDVFVVMTINLDKQMTILKEGPRKRTVKLKNTNRKELSLFRVTQR